MYRGGKAQCRISRTFEILEQIGCWHVEGGWLFLMYCI